jgi:flagellar hook-associated protein 3 FlgL
VFSGYKSTTVPFVQTSSGVRYDGDQGQAQLQVGTSRKVAIGDAGSSVFAALPTGNGAFVTSAGGSNTGGATISAGTVTDPSKLTGHSYSIDFTFTAGTPAAPPLPATADVTRYQVMDKTKSPPVAVGTPTDFNSGDSITVAGMTFDIQGMPANNDSFDVVPSDKQTLFQTLSKMIDTLRAPAGTPAEKKALTDGLSAASGSLSAALDNVLAVRASVGTRQKEFDTLDTAGDDADIQYASTLSNLQDLDVIKAISLFTQQQSTLDAAQKTFKSVSGLSLFNYIS